MFSKTFEDSSFLFFWDGQSGFMDIDTAAILVFSSRLKNWGVWAPVSCFWVMKVLINFIFLSWYVNFSLVTLRLIPVLLSLVCLMLQLKTAGEAADFAYVGAAVGAIATGGNAWRWSKSPHGMLQFFVCLGLFLWLTNCASLWIQICLDFSEYFLDTITSSICF